MFTVAILLATQQVSMYRNVSFCTSCFLHNKSYQFLHYNVLPFSSVNSESWDECMEFNDWMVWSCFVDKETSCLFYVFRKRNTQVRKWKNSFSHYIKGQIYLEVWEYWVQSHLKLSSFLLSTKAICKVVGSEKQWLSDKPFHLFELRLHS